MQVYMEEKAENEVKIKFRNSTYKVMWNCQQSGNFCMKKKDVTENFYFRIKIPIFISIKT